VYESNPTAENLIGHIEHRAEFGSLVTDFTMIRAGALHRANGGYLIVDAERTLTKPAAWDALKRALFDRRLRIESIGQMLAIGPGLALEPDPIPLDVKVILLGSAQLYYTLADLDPDFPQLFRIAADFAERVPRDDATLAAYAGLIATQARAARLRALDAAAVAAVIDQGIRMAGDRDRISAHTRRLVDLMREADQVAATEGARTITAGHVRSALAMQIERLDRLRTEMHERIVQGTVVIDVGGRAIGQVNGLTVLQLGELAFGQPARITATARLGRGQLIDIEREAKLGGNIHSKAVLIVSSFIGHRFGQLHPLAFNASLVFEQSYGGIEGDSASVAEVCALLSAIAGIPLRQDLAITGSMNQHGRVQAIGGANEKIEGFFDICSGRGLTGTQGAVLPADNVRHLMLREDVVAAVAAGRFHVHAIEQIDDALALLTGLPAGERGADDEYPPDSVNGRVARRLEELWQRARRASASDPDKGSGT
jgi:lon-related putative ATP-dependent protease